MKTSKILSALALSALLVVGFNVSAQVPMGVGPVVCGSVQTSNLPDKAMKFIHKHFSNATIASAQKDYAEDEYDVILSNGIKVEFTAKGDFKEIDAPGQSSLPETVVKSVVPDKTYKELTKRGLAQVVESIEYSKKGYEVDFNHPTIDKANFSSSGSFINLEYD